MVCDSLNEQTLNVLTSQQQEQDLYQARLYLHYIHPVVSETDLVFIVNLRVKNTAGVRREPGRCDYAYRVVPRPWLVAEGDVIYWYL